MLEYVHLLFHVGVRIGKIKDGGRGPAPSLISGRAGLTANQAGQRAALGGLQYEGPPCSCSASTSWLKHATRSRPSTEEGWPRKRVRVESWSHPLPLAMSQGRPNPVSNTKGQGCPRAAPNILQRPLRPSSSVGVPSKSLFLWSQSISRSILMFVAERGRRDWLVFGQARSDGHWEGGVKDGVCCHL